MLHLCKCGSASIRIYSQRTCLSVKRHLLMTSDTDVKYTCRCSWLVRGSSFNKPKAAPRCDSTLLVLPSHVSKQSMT